jgi:hypothetical protein
MARDGSGVFSSAVADVETNTEISSTHFNAFKADLVADANLDRPIAAGGTGASTAAAARTNLGVALAQTSVNDATAGSALIVGAFGLGGNTPTSADWSAETLTKFLRTGAASTTGAPSTGDIWTGLHVNRNASEAWQVGVAASTADLQMRFRTAAATWGNWLKSWHGGNVKGTVAQSSDIPTGALFEEATDSGASTSYTRFADGTQIVTAWRQAFQYESTARLQLTITLPKAFIDANYCVSVTLRPATGSSNENATDDTAVPGVSMLLPPIVGTKTTTSFTSSVYRISGGSNFTAPDLLYGDFTIIGRWYA